MKEQGDLLDELPEHVQTAFLEAENPALAVYALAKEGKLQTLITMSPYQAAMAIGRAQDRGEALTKAKQVTNAPAPIAPAKGSGQGGKTLDRMDGNELMAWLKSP